MTIIYHYIDTSYIKGFCIIPDEWLDPWPPEHDEFSLAMPAEVPATLTHAGYTFEDVPVVRFKKIPARGASDKQVTRIVVVKNETLLAAHPEVTLA